jgi:hypothetical protein
MALVTAAVMRFFSAEGYLQEREREGWGERCQYGRLHKNRDS